MTMPKTPSQPIPIDDPDYEGSIPIPTDEDDANHIPRPDDADNPPKYSVTAD